MILPNHGGQLREIAQTFGLDPAAILDFSANINPQGPPASVKAAIRQALLDPETLTAYPDLDLFDLRTAIARYLSSPTAQLTPDYIAVANGFAPLLEATIRGLKLTHTLVPVPAFSEYRATLERCGTTVTTHLLDPATFAYNPEFLERQLRASNADSLLLANPQNPSGVLAPAQTLVTLAHRNPGVKILLDEAFIDYVPDQSAIPHLLQLPNLTIFRSVTKFFAMPGLRVAYAAGNPETMSKLRRHLAPWPVSTLAAIATIAALAHSSFAQAAIELNRTRRNDLVEHLVTLGITCPPPAANFLLLRLPYPAAPLWQRLLAEHSILLRRCDNFENLGPNHLRTAVRNEHDNQRLIAALAACLDSQPISDDSPPFTDNSYPHNS